MPRKSITVGEARRIALAAQGFADPRPAGRVDARHVRRVIDRVGVLQIDSVNVLCRSHYLPVFARLGPYPRDLLDRMSWGAPGRELFEVWAHMASLVPLRSHPLLRWRMEAAERHPWGSGLQAPYWQWSRRIGAPWAVMEGMTRLARERPRFADDVLAVVAERGPISAAELAGNDSRRGGPRAEGGRMWNWRDAKIALEWLFSTGKVATTRRNFERIYDLAARAIPAAALAAPTPSLEDAQRELVRVAARALGVATEGELGDYFQLLPKHSKARVGELVETGELVPVRIDDLPERRYLWREARLPRRVHARALLSPFDSLIWDRDRTLRLFGFHYRIGIYTPAAKRVHGYYVLPFLLRDRLAARVDLKAVRTESTLLVQAAYAEPDVGDQDVAGELAEELRLMAAWLDLDRVSVTGNGDLGPALSRALGRGG